MVGAALENLTSSSGLIADGHHVDWAALRIALRTRPIDRFMLVTDAMPTVGSETKTFVLNGQTITVRDGVCVGPDGTLAGSDLDMATAVRNTVEHIGRTLGEAAIMAANRALQVMNRELEFELDPQSGRLVTRLIDTSDNEVLRQIPSEDMLRIARALDRIQGLLFEQQA